VFPGIHGSPGSSIELPLRRVCQDQIRGKMFGRESLEKFGEALTIVFGGGDSGRSESVHCEQEHGSCQSNGFPRPLCDDANPAP